MRLLPTRAPGHRRRHQFQPAHPKTGLMIGQSCRLSEAGRFALRVNLLRWTLARRMCLATRVAMRSARRWSRRWMKSFAAAQARIGTPSHPTARESEAWKATPRTWPRHHHSKRPAAVTTIRRVCAGDVGARDEVRPASNCSCAPCVSGADARLWRNCVSELTEAEQRTPGRVPVLVGARSPDDVSVGPAAEFVCQAHRSHPFTAAWAVRAVRVARGVGCREHSIGIEALLLRPAR